MAFILPESGYKHISLMSVDGSMDVKGFPWEINNKGCDLHLRITN